MCGHLYSRSVKNFITSEIVYFVTRKENHLTTNDVVLKMMKQISLPLHKKQHFLLHHNLHRSKTTWVSFRLNIFLNITQENLMQYQNEMWHCLIQKKVTMSDLKQWWLWRRQTIRRPFTRQDTLSKNTECLIYQMSYTNICIRIYH